MSKAQLDDAFNVARAAMVREVIAELKEACALSEGMQHTVMNVAEVRYFADRLEAILALRSGASAQPAESFGPLSVRCPACKSQPEVPCIGTGPNGTHWERRRLVELEQSKATAAQPAGGDK